MGGILNAIAAGPTPVATYQNQFAQQRQAQANTQAVQQETALNQLKQQQMQRDLQDSALTRQFLQKHNGDFEQVIADPEYLGQVQPNTALGIKKAVVENSKAAADTQKLQADAKDAQAKADQAHAALAGDTAYGLAKSGYSPAALDAAMLDMEQRGLMDSQHAEAIRKTVAQDPTQAKPIIDQLALNSPARQKDLEIANQATTAGAASTTAEARKTAAQTAADKFAQIELPKAQTDQTEANLKIAQTQKEQDAEMLSAAARQGPAAFSMALGKLPYDRAKPFEGLTKPEDIVKVALTPEQITTNTMTQAQRDEQVRHNKIEETQGAGRLQVERGRLAMEQTQMGLPSVPGGVSPAAQMAVDGRMDPATLRAQLRKNPGLIGQIQKLDPNFDEADLDKRFNTLKEFTNSSNTKAGGQALALNTLVHHADLFAEAADALHNGTFRPGNAAYNAISTMMGSPAPNNASLVGHFLAGEAAKAAKGGVPSQGEAADLEKTLGPMNSPEQLRGAAQTLIGIAGGRLIPLQEKVDDAKLGSVVHVLGPDAKQILQKHGYNPDTMKPAGQAGNAGPTTPANQKEYDALPKGAQFKKPGDPKIYVKQ